MSITALQSGSTPSGYSQLISAQVPESKKVKSIWEKVQSFLNGKGFDNGTQATFTAVQAIGTMNRSGQVLSPQTLPQAPACFLGSNTFLSAVSLVSCGFLTASAVQYGRDIAASEKELEAEKAKALQPKSFEGVLSSQKIKDLTKRIQLLYNGLKGTLLNLCNIVAQAGSSIASLVGNIINPSSLLNPGITTAGALGQGIAWAGVAGAIIGLVVGTYLLVQNVRYMVANRNQKAELLQQLAALQELKGKQPHELLDLEETRLKFELQKIDNEFTHLKWSLFSNITMLLGCCLSLAINIASGGIFEIVSWAFVGIVLISGISSAIHKLKLNKELAKAEDLIKQNTFPLLPLNVDQMAPLTKLQQTYFADQFGAFGNTSEENLRKLALLRFHSTFAVKIESRFGTPPFNPELAKPFKLDHDSIEKVIRVKTTPRKSPPVLDGALKV